MAMNYFYHRQSYSCLYHWLVILQSLVIPHRSYHLQIDIPLLDLCRRRFGCYCRHRHYCLLVRLLICRRCQSFCCCRHHIIISYYHINIKSYIAIHYIPVLPIDSVLLPNRTMFCLSLSTLSRLKMRGS